MRPPAAAPGTSSLMRDFAVEIDFSSQQYRRSAPSCDYGSYMAFLKALRSRLRVCSLVQKQPPQQARSTVRQIVSDCIEQSGAPRAMCLAFVNKHRSQLEQVISNTEQRGKARSDHKSFALHSADRAPGAGDRRSSFGAAHTARFMLLGSGEQQERSSSHERRASFMSGSSETVVQDATSSIVEFASRKVDDILASVLSSALA